MGNHIEHAKHNKDFIDCLCNHFPEQFFDWKTTALFYEALHLLKEYAETQQVDLGGTHEKISEAVNPASAKKVIKLEPDEYKNYNRLYTLSRSARYEGFTDIETFQKLKASDYEIATQYSKRWKAYMKKLGLDF